MKKSLLALAVLGAFAGTASAQSSVTLFGIIDLGYRNVENHDTSQSQMSQDGINSSRLGVRGVEDMGGGLRAGFWLEGAINPDTGTPSGQTWQRRSTVSLIGNWGEVRLGRDYTPGFWNTTIFDPFGTNGVGSFLNMAAAAPDGSAGNNLYVRASNSVGYFLPPNLGGFYGQVMINAGENTQPYTKLSYSARLGWAGGPFNVAASFQETDATTPDATHNNLAGSWNFGFMTLMGQWDMVEVGNAEQETWLIGGVIPMGQGEIHVSYVSTDISGTTAAGANLNGNGGDQFAIGYVYNLSKRTALYGTYSQISNDGASRFSVGNLTNVTGNGFTAGGQKSTGYEFGLRHAF
jgi:predicted porin